MESADDRPNSMRPNSAALFDADNRYPSLWPEYILDFDPEIFGQAESQLQTGLVLFCFDGVDSLTAHSKFVRQLLLGKLPLLPKYF